MGLDGHLWHSAAESRVQSVEQVGQLRMVQVVVEQIVGNCQCVFLLGWFILGPRCGLDVAGDADKRVGHGRGHIGGHGGHRCHRGDGSHKGHGNDKGPS